MEEGISKFALYRALTGTSEVIDLRKPRHPRVSQFSGDPVTIDVSVESERNRAYELVKQMEIGYAKDNVLSNYYNPCFKSIHESYAKNNHEQFKEDLQMLVDTIHME